MIKRTRSIAVATVLGLLMVFPPLTASAGQYISSWGTITQLESHGDGVRVYGLDLSPNPAGCSNPSAATVHVSLSAAKREGLGRALIAAFLSGRKVKVKLHATECNFNTPVIYGVWTK